MFQFVTTVYNSYFPKNFQQPDPMKDPNIFHHLDWQKTVVGGSHALQQFTGDSNWMPHNIYIFMSSTSKKEYLQAVQRFKDGTSSKIIDSKDFTSSYGANQISSQRDEKFHEFVHGTTTLHLPSGKEVQLINLYGSKSPIEILNQTTDLPSCVSYTVLENGERIFHVPEKGREALFRREISVKDICQSRQEKYRQRGYTYK